MNQFTITRKTWLFYRSFGSIGACEPGGPQDKLHNQSFACGTLKSHFRTACELSVNLLENLKPGKRVHRFPLITTDSTKEKGDFSLLLRPAPSNFSICEICGNLWICFTDQSFSARWVCADSIASACASASRGCQYQFLQSELTLHSVAHHRAGAS